MKVRVNGRVTTVIGGRWVQLSSIEIEPGVVLDGPTYEILSERGDDGVHETGLHGRGYLDHPEFLRGWE